MLGEGDETGDGLAAIGDGDGLVGGLAEVVAGAGVKLADGDGFHGRARLRVRAAGRLPDKVSHVSPSSERGNCE